MLQGFVPAVLQGFTAFMLEMFGHSKIPEFRERS